MIDMSILREIALSVHHTCKPLMGSKDGKGPQVPRSHPAGASASAARLAHAPRLAPLCAGMAPLVVRHVARGTPRGRGRGHGGKAGMSDRQGGKGGGGGGDAAPCLGCMALACRRSLGRR